MSAAGTALEMIIAVGEPVQLRCNDGAVWVDCVVRDVKNSWGKNRLLVAPVAGDGQVWVELTSVRKRALSAAARAWEVSE
jgi:hypothetical protein